ncbi:MAG TPA: MoaD/ThiS family protein, partial [Bacteroidia bacterium]|nr:MoaD/ThiS family protein [Bacteroidia bacterium]
KAVGRSSVILEEASLPICEILTLLRRNAKEPEVLTPNNILIAVNGVEASSLDGTDTVVESGDTVTIVTVAHGG